MTVRASRRTRRTACSNPSIAQRQSARLVSGSGIGLFVCARLIEAMDGRIWARSRPEGGAEFGFALRLVEDLAED